MGNAKFYFTPEPFGALNGATLVTIDLGEALRKCTVIYPSRLLGLFSDWLNTKICRSTQEIVTIQRDRMIGGEDLAIQFHAS